MTHQKMQASKDANHKQEWAGPESDGFQGQLSCSSIADLVQLQCLSRVRCAVSVSSPQGQGMLFFAEGQVVHCETARNQGNEAAIEIMGWESGSFGTSQAVPPDEPTVTHTWESLLMLAAKRKDEENRVATSKGALQAVPADTQEPINDAKTVKPPPIPAPPGRKRAEERVSPPYRVPKPARVDPSLAEPVEDHAFADQHAPLLSGERRSVERERGTEPDMFAGVTGAVRLDADGELVWQRGQSEHLVGLVAYVRGIVDLVGLDLGVGNFKTFESDLGDYHVLIAVEDSNSVIAIELPAGADRSVWCKRLGF